MEKVDFDDLKQGKSEIRNCHINIGTGKEISIKNVADLVKAAVNYKGNITYDTSKPDGTMRKLTNVSKLNSLGWMHKIEIDEGIKKLYDWYLKNL